MYSFKSRGWYAYLSSKEQNILKDPTIFISNHTIPDNLIQGISRNEMADFKKILYENVQNCSMFRDGTCDSMLFQQMIHTNKYNRSKHKRVTVDDDHSNTKRSSSHSNLSLEEVPSIQNLKEQVEKLFIREENDFSASTFVSWNFLFY